MVISEQDAINELEVVLQALRRGGSPDCSAVEGIVAAFTDRVNILHRAGVIKQLQGMHDEAIDFLQRALVALPDFHYSQIELGHTYRLMGRDREALAWYEKAVASAPGYMPSYMLAATVRRELGDAPGSAALLARAQAVEPDNQQIASELAFALVYINRRSDAVAALGPIVRRPDANHELIARYLVLLTEVAEYRQLLDFLPHLPRDPSAQLRAYVDLFAGHARMALAVDRDAVLAAAAAREATSAWCSTNGVLAALRAAITARQPFSLVRIGDGEGRFLAYMDPMTRRGLSEYDACSMVDSIWQNWFGEAHTAVDP